MRLSKAQREVLRLCDQPLGFYADDMSGMERRTAMRLRERGLLSSSDGKRAYITPAGLAALSQEAPHDR